MSQSKYVGRGGDDAERDRPPQSEPSFPVERLGQPLEGGGVAATGFLRRMEEVVSALAVRDVQLPAYAAKFGIPLSGLDIPKDVPMRLAELYSGVRVHEDQDNTYYTVCLGLNKFPGDPKTAYVVTREVDATDTSGGISKSMPGIYSYWENHDGPETNFAPMVHAEGYYDISAWAKYHLAVPKSGGNPYLIINPLQYSSLTIKARRDFEAELQETAEKGPTSTERHKAAWRLRNISSPYQYSDRDTALGILGLEVAQQLGLETVCTPYGKVNATLRQNNRGIGVVDGMRPA